MKIERIEIENFMKYQRADFSFGERTSIFGPNGSGKSTIVEAIFYALTGTFLRMNHPHMATRKGQSRHSVNLYLRYKENRWKIVRTYDSIAEKKRTAMLFQWKDGRWTPVYAETQTPVFEYLTGINVNHLRSGPFVSQNEVHRLTLAYPSEKRDFFIDILLSGRKIKKIYEKIKADLIAAEKEMAALRVMLAHEKEKLLPDYEQVREELKEFHPELTHPALNEIRLSKIILHEFHRAGWTRGWDEFCALSAQAKAYFRNLKSKKQGVLKEWERKNTEVISLREKYKALRSQIAEIQFRLDAIPENRQHAVALHSEQIEKSIREIEEQMRELEFQGAKNWRIGKDVCPTCLRPIDSIVIRSIENERQKRLSQIVLLQDRLKKQKELLREARVREANEQKKQTLQSLLEKSLKEKEKIRQQGEQLTHEMGSRQKFFSLRLRRYVVPDAKTLARVARIDAKIRAQAGEVPENFNLLLNAHEYDENYVTKHIRLSGLAQRAKEHEKASKKVSACLSEIARKEELIQSLKALAQLLAPDGRLIHDMLSDSLQSVNQIASRVISQMDAKYQKIQVTQDRENNGIEIKILRQDGAIFSFEQLSGGEKVKVSLGLRIALSILSAMRSEIHFFVLDESFDGLDGDSRHAALSFLEDIPGLQIIIISHDEEMMKRWGDAAISTVEMLE